MSLSDRIWPGLRFLQDEIDSLSEGGSNDGYARTQLTTVNTARISEDGYLQGEIVALNATDLANDPSPSQKEALVGSYGTPNTANPYITDTDPSVVRATEAELHVYADGTLGNDANDGLQKSAGTGGSFSVLAGVVTFTGTGAAWTTADVGRLLTINYATNPDNNGSFAIVSVPAGNQVTYANAFGVTEAMPAGGKWTVSSPKLSIQAAVDLIPEFVTYDTCAHLSGALSAGLPYVEKHLKISKNLVIDGGSATKPVSSLNGSGDTLAASGGVVTLTDAGANFTTALVGKTINIGAATTAAHLGNFTITGAPTPTTLTWANAGTLPASEAYTGMWTIYPFDEVRTGTGDGFTFGGGNVTLTDAGASFTAADKGKSITIVGSTSGPGFNDGTFVIATVVDANNVTYANINGATEAFTGTWTLGAFTADIASSSSLGLTTAGWSVDQWAGCWMEVLTGAAAGQTRLVQGNTATTVTPVRNFSVSPGTGAKFRFVRPATTITTSFFTLGNISASTTGSFAGWTTLQNVTLALNCQFQYLITNTYLNVVGLFVTSLNTFPINVFGNACLAISGNRVNPHTFATESATTNTSVGCSLFNRQRVEYGVYVGALIRGLSGCQVGSSFFATLTMQEPANDVWIFWRGTRVLSLHLTQARGNNQTSTTAGGSGSIQNTSGYATTKFGGHPCKASFAGIIAEGSYVMINSCDINGWNDYGIHLNQSVVHFITNNVTGVMGKAGMYIHSLSVCHLKTGVIPTLSGTTIGNITTDEVTLASTWAAVAGGTPLVAGSELSMVKVFDSPMQKVN